MISCYQESLGGSAFFVASGFHLICANKSVWVRCGQVSFEVPILAIQPSCLIALYHSTIFKLSPLVPCKIFLPFRVRMAPKACDLVEAVTSKRRRYPEEVGVTVGSGASYEQCSMCTEDRRQALRCQAPPRCGQTMTRSPRYLLISEKINKSRQLKCR